MTTPLCQIRVYRAAARGEDLVRHLDGELTSSELQEASGLIHHENFGKPIFYPP